ncbi:hypothetical protein MESS4_510214 [Mesorhizobium sp. STM 4661]|nr:hypothetical protein MESS4_510214 [Mesorhizobium sp. STM 4661]
MTWCSAHESSLKPTDRAALTAIVFSTYCTPRRWMPRHLEVISYLLLFVIRTNETFVHILWGCLKFRKGCLRRRIA